jgi:hypothetical protein
MTQEIIKENEFIKAIKGKFNAEVWRLDYTTSKALLSNAVDNDRGAIVAEVFDGIKVDPAHAQIEFYGRNIHTQTAQNSNSCAVKHIELGKKSAKPFNAFLEGAYMTIKDLGNVNIKQIHGAPLGRPSVHVDTLPNPQLYQISAGNHAALDAMADWFGCDIKHVPSNDQVKTAAEILGTSVIELDKRLTQNPEKVSSIIARLL